MIISHLVIVVYGVYDTRYQPYRCVDLVHTPVYVLLIPGIYSSIPSTGTYNILRTIYQVPGCINSYDVNTSVHEETRSNRSGTSTGVMLMMFMISQSVFNS